MEFQLPIKIKYIAHPEERRTRYYPGCPGHVEVIDILLKNELVHASMFNRIMETHGKEIERACLEHVQDREMAQAEHMYDVKTGR